MFGLDDQIAGLSDGTMFAILIAVAGLLGLRHATDPDHLAAVATIVAAGRERTRWLSARLGLAWGIGHALTLFTFGLPVVLFAAFLPHAVQQGAETLVGIVIAGLAVWLLVRWRRGFFHGHPSEHERARGRSPLQAFSIGLLHGVGGSAGICVLLLAAVHDRAQAVAALGVLAVATAVSMTVITGGLGLALDRGAVHRAFHRLAPALGLASLSFGCWYALGALDLVPYYA